MVLGAAPPQGVKREVMVLEHIPLDEAPIEGYHREIAMLTARAHDLKLAGAFAEVRRKNKPRADPEMDAATRWS